MADPAEVFEVVDRFTNRRLEEAVYLTSSTAFAQVAEWPDYAQRCARVQSVVVRSAPVRLDLSEKTAAEIEADDNDD